jgi:hypothetical protein
VIPDHILWTYHRSSCHIIVSLDNKSPRHRMFTLPPILGCLEGPDGILEGPDGGLEGPDGGLEGPDGGLEGPDGALTRPPILPLFDSPGLVSPGSSLASFSFSGRFPPELVPFPVLTGVPLGFVSTAPGSGGGLGGRPPDALAVEKKSGGGRGRGGGRGVGRGGGMIGTTGSENMLDSGDFFDDDPKGSRTRANLAIRKPRKMRTMQLIIMMSAIVSFGVILRRRHWR